MELEIIQDDDGRFITPYLCIEDWGKFGTTLKPAFEPIIIARKPFKGSLVDNVLEYGVGGLNIDECRVDYNGEIPNIGGRGKHTRGEGYGFKALGENCVANENGRFPANVILTYDETDFDEVCGGFPYSESHKTKGTDNRQNKGNSMFIDGIRNENNSYSDSGSVSRYFMNCKYNRKDEDIWKNLFVNNVETNLEIILAIKENIVQMNVEELLKKLKDHYVKYVENQQELIETSIVQDIVKILRWDLKIETSQVIQDFIINYDKCIQFLNLVQFVEKMDNIDTTPTTQNLLKLFGYVKVAITNYILGNVKLEQKRYLYTPKASKKDRDEGLDKFEEKQVYGNDMNWGYENNNGDNLGERIANVKRKNTHPTVKPI